MNTLVEQNNSFITFFSQHKHYPDPSLSNRLTFKSYESSVNTSDKRWFGAVGSFLFFSGFPQWNENQNLDTVSGNPKPRYGFPETELNGRTNMSQLIYPMYNDNTIKNCFIFIGMNNIIETSLLGVKP
jgi:hypothetical protein